LSLGGLYSLKILNIRRKMYADNEQLMTIFVGVRYVFTGCPAYTFQCGDGQCLPEYELCNAVVTCADKSDELEGLCGGGAPMTVGNRTSAARPPQPLTRVRGAYRHSPAECPFRCRNGRCRSTAVLCSGRDGCGDGSDESGCSVCSKYRR